LRECGHGAPRRGDLLARATAELVRGPLDLDGQLAVAEDLDQGVLANRTLGHQLVHTDGTALREQPVDVTDVDDLVLGAEPVAESLELGQPHVNRHLPALEGRRNALACLGALGTAAGGLALGPLTATDPGTSRLRPGRGLQVVQFDGHLASSTCTRWLTTAIRPRVCALSSRITEWRIRRSPRVRRLSR